MWSEFYFTAGNASNVSLSNNDLTTQCEREVAYRHYVEGVAALGFVVGVEWFIGCENPDQGGPLLFSARQILLGAGKGNFFSPVSKPLFSPSCAPTTKSKFLAIIAGRRRK